MAKAVLNNKIWLRASDLPMEIIEDIQASTSVPNPEKTVALEQKMWGADKLPDYLNLYEWQGEWLILPRGFYKRLHDGLESVGITLDVEDQMTDIRLDWFHQLSEPSLRDYQIYARDDMAYYAQGIYQAPTGSGKTVTMLGLIRRLAQPTLIIVNKKELIQQWSDRTETFLGFKPGFIGDGRWEESELTIATQQTLWSRRKDIEPDFWSRWGCVVLDECHSVQAETYREIISNFTAKFRFGVSATPRKTGEFKIAQNILGPVIHKTAKAPLRDAGYLITPKVFVVPTQFHHPFHQNEVKVAKTGREYVSRRNNFHEVIDKLVRSSARNKLIVSKAIELQGRCILILTKRLAHIELLKEEFQAQGRNVLVLTGQEKLEERMEVYKQASFSDCIILSTIADEAVDIPRIDTLFLIYPIKNLDGFRQQVGRGERPHTDKVDYKIFDFVDYTIEPIKQQYLDRRRQVYRPEGLKVSKIS